MTSLPRGNLRRVRLFVRDVWEELPSAWSLARMNDCERNGGHRWGAATTLPMIGLAQTCSRCKCSQSVNRTTGTGTTAGATYCVGGSNQEQSR